MRHVFNIYILLFTLLAISACSSSNRTSETNWTTSPSPTATITPTATFAITPTETQPHSPTPMPPTPTDTLQPTDTATLTPPPTLEPEQAEEAIRTLLQVPVDCSAPCFWGIIQGQTKLGEAKNIFTRLGLQLDGPRTISSYDYYEIIYDFDSGLSISPLLAVRNSIIKNITIYITPEKSQPGIPREWLAYSPETLTRRYGLPSEVVFFVGRAAPTPGYSMVLYFDKVDLIIEYDGYDYTFDGSSFEICPLTNQWDNVRVWMGENPHNPPPSFGVPLQEATSLTMEEFSELMTGDPEKACFELKGEVFP